MKKKVIYWWQGGRLIGSDGSNRSIDEAYKESSENFAIARACEGFINLPRVRKAAKRKVVT